MFGRLPLILFGIIFFIGTFWTWLAVHDHNLRVEIIAEFNAQQEQLLAEKKVEFEKQMKDLQDKTSVLQKEIDDKNASIGTMITEIESSASKMKDAGDNATPYLKEIIKNMQKSFGEKVKK
jgi:uncharacterized protein YlxW (UPF0749 family)